MPKNILELEINGFKKAFIESNNVISEISHSINDESNEVVFVIIFKEKSTIQLKIIFIKNILKSVYDYDENHNKKALSEKEVYKRAIEFNKMVNPSIHNYFLRKDYNVKFF